MVMWGCVMFRWCVSGFNFLWFVFMFNFCLFGRCFLRAEAGEGGAEMGGGGAGAESLLGGVSEGEGEGEVRIGGEVASVVDEGGGSGGVRYDLADEGAMCAWREALGMNREFAGEEFLPAVPEGLPDGVWDADAVEVLGRKAWELGVPKDAFAGIVYEFASRTAEAQRVAAEAEVQRLADVTADLKGVWGDAYVTRMKGAVQAVEVLGRLSGIGADEVDLLVNDPVVGSHPVLIRMLAQMGEMLGDEGAKGLGASGGGAAGGGAAGGREEAERIMSDASHPLHEAFMNTSHQNHRFADDQYNRLMGIK